METTKVCRTCGETKPFDEYYKAHSTSDGYAGECKPCYLRRCSEYRKRNRDKIREYKKQYRGEHPGSGTETTRKWKENNPDKVALYQERQREIYKEQASDPEFVARRRMRVAARAKQLAETGNKDEGRVERALRRRWRSRHNGDSTCTVEQWIDLCNCFGNVCLRCGASTNLTKDHVIPLALGGPDHITNIQPLCMACNLSKGFRIIRDYRDPEKLAQFLAVLK